MAHATSRRQHPNAPLTVEGRRRMVGCVVDRGWTIEATATRFQIDAKTVRKWRDRFVAEREQGLQDRSSRPRRSPNRTPKHLRVEVLRLRRKRRWGADHIAFEVGLAASTVQGRSFTTPMSRTRSGNGPTRSVEIEKTRPSCPSFKRFCISWRAELKRSMWPTAAVRPASAKAFCIRSAAATLYATGFSTSIWTPAPASRIAARS